MSTTRTSSPVSGPRRAARTPLALAILLACESAAAPINAAHAESLTTQAAFDRAWSDPRLQDVDSLSVAEVADIAIDFGMQAFMPPSLASTRVVSNCNNSGPGSLRDVVASSVSGDIVDLRSLPCSTITLSSGQINIGVQSLSITGPGPGALTIQNGNGAKYTNRIFNHTGSGTLIVQGMTLTGGVISGNASVPDARGGCVNSEGTVFLGNSFFVTDAQYGVRVTNCRAISVQGSTRAGSADGGGVSGAVVVLTNSIVSGCSTSGPAGSGGGVFVRARFGMNKSELVGNNNGVRQSYNGGGGANAVAGFPNLIVDSTIAANTSYIGGGLSISKGTVIRNSTISGNNAYMGAGILSGGLFGGDVTISNSTITQNVTNSFYGGGGIMIRPSMNRAIVQLYSTIVSANRRFDGPYNDIWGDAQYVGASNLVGPQQLPAPAMPAGTLFGFANLAALANNGGATRTHALLAGGLAIDAGNNATNAERYDQRGLGYPRVRGVRADIGAFEFDPAHPSSASGK